MAERGRSQQVGRREHFMRNGFNEWAESERPARDGGLEKEPAEATSPLEGGFSLTEIATKMKQFYDDAKVYSPIVKSVLRSDGLARAAPKSAATAKKVADYMEMVGLGHCKEVGMELHGMGFRGTAEEFAKAAKKVYDFMKENKATIHAVLNIPQLNEKTNNYPKKVSDILKMVGLGKMKDGEEYSSESDCDDEMEGKGFIEGGAYGHAKANDALLGSGNLDVVIRRVAEQMKQGHSEAKIRAILKEAKDLSAKQIGEVIKQAKSSVGMGIKLSPSVMKTLSKSQIASIDPDPLGVGKKIKKSIKKSGVDLDPLGVGKKIKKAIGKGAASMKDIGDEQLRRMMAQKSFESNLANMSNFNEMASGRKVGTGKGKSAAAARMEELVEAAKKGKIGAAGKTKTYMDSTEHDLSELSPMGEKMGSGKKKKAPSARNLVVKKVMREKGLSLPQASKYVKEHGLY